MPTLNDLAIGATASVVKLTGEAGVKRRLLEMGLTPTTKLELIRRAPLGDPLEIKVRNFHLSLRRDEAACIEIV
jgi:ferrous iron transport protein A